MRWSTAELERFETRRSADGARTTATVRARPSAGSRKAHAAGTEPTETQIHMAVAAHLRHRAAPGVWWSHFPAGELRDERIGAKLRQMGTKKGVPDFLLIIRGKTYALELKRSAGRLSPDQWAAQAEIERAGGLVHTAYSIDEALSVLAAWGAITPTPGRIAA